MDGKWVVEPRPDPSDPYPLYPIVRPSGGDAVRDPWIVTGDPIRAMAGIQRTIGRRCDLVYIDCPRIHTNAGPFDAADTRALLGTWLSLVDELFRRALLLAADRGAVAVMCGAEELPYVQLVLSERSGAANFIGAIAWQKNYSARNMPNMREVSPVHDSLLLTARRKVDLPSVALRVPPAKFANPDGDPRDAWNAEQKGANKPDCDYAINVPPYRWRLTSGSLPPGVWRVSPKSGVIWGLAEDITTAGEWSFTVQVTDREGNSATKEFSITVAVDASEPAPYPPPWLIAANVADGDIVADGSELSITTDALPAARVGSSYYACLTASGGAPWTGTTRPGKTAKSGKGRYWEYPVATLMRAAAQDMIDFKSKDDAIPAIKKYLAGRIQTRLNQRSLWLAVGKSEEDGLGVGWAEDAKEELEALVAAGVVARTVQGSKPAPLVSRLLALFTSASSWVVDIGSPAGEMAAIATAFGRRAVYVPLGSEAVDEVVRPRLTQASRGLHPTPAGPIFSPDGRDSEGSSASTEPVVGYFVDGQLRSLDDGAAVCDWQVGPSVATIDRLTGTIALDYSQYPAGSASFLDALANIEGLVPEHDAKAAWFASSIDGTLRVAYVPADEWLGGETVERISRHHEDHLARGGRVRVYAHRGAYSPDDDGRLPSIDSRLIPFDLKAVVGAL
jgi:hypothetical protein